MSEVQKMLTTAENQTEVSFPWGMLRWLMNDKLSAGTEQTLGLCRIEVGQKNPFHYHPNCEEVLYILSGKGTHSFDGDKVELRPGMTLRVPQGVKHDLVNTGDEPIVCIIAFSSGDRQTVFLE